MINSMAKTNKFYAVLVGRTPGIYNTWDECLQRTQGFSGAQFKSFTSYQDALDYMNGTTSVTTAKYVYPSISIDASCSGNPGKMEYQGVDTKTKELLFHVGPIDGGTNNIGEFIALVHGILHLKGLKKNIPIYTDSKTAQAWLKNKKFNTSVRPILGSKLDKLIKRTEEVLPSLPEWEVLKWNTKEWGEIPADFGRK